MVICCNKLKVKYENIISKIDEQINNELDTIRKEISQYLVKPEYLNFEYTDEASKSSSFTKYAKKYFNKKVLQSAHVGYDVVLNLYDRYYKIHAFEALYRQLFNQAIDLKFKGFPESDIIDHYYDEFISSGYYVDSDDDLYKFCKEENKKRAEMAKKQEEIRKRKEFEM